MMLLGLWFLCLLFRLQEVTVTVFLGFAGMDEKVKEGDLFLIGVIVVGYSIMGYLILDSCSERDMAL